MDNVARVAVMKPADQLLEISAGALFVETASCLQEFEKLSMFCILQNHQEDVSLFSSCRRVHLLTGANISQYEWMRCCLQRLYFPFLRIVNTI